MLQKDFRKIELGLLSFISFSKKTIIPILLIVFSNFQLFAEGTKQVSPTDNDWTILTLLNGFAGYGSGSTDRALCIDILDDTEEVYIALSELAYGDYRDLSDSPYEFRILDSARNIVHGPFTIDPTNLNGSNYADVVAGPDLGSGTGYDISDPAFHFSPGFKGRFCIEFRLTVPFNTTGAQNQGIAWWDFTVTNSAGVEQPGRLFSKNWSFRTTCDNCADIFTQPFNGKIFVLTDDGFVHSIDFFNSGFRGLTFDLAFNKKGPRNTGDFQADRRSVNGLNATNPEFRVFLQDPDPALYSEPTIGAVLNNPTFSNPGDCDTLNTFCFDFNISQPGSIEMILDLDQGDSLYTHGTADLVLRKVYRDTVGLFTFCVDWDSRDGLGNPVDLSDPIPSLIRYSQGEINFMMHDVEYNNPGYKIEIVHPATAQFFDQLYYDDSQLDITDNDVNLDGDNNPNTGTNPPLIELNGCDSPCHTWNRNTTTQTEGFGESNTINTWWQGNLQVLDLNLTGFCALNDIEVEKSVVNLNEAVSGNEGNFDVEYEVLIENTGNSILNNLQLMDDMNANFGSSYIGLVQGPVFSAQAGTPFLPNPSSTFGTNFFNGTSGELKPGDILKVLFTVELDPMASGTFQTLSNQAEAFGEYLQSGEIVSDLSNDSVSPTTTDEPTVVQFPKIGVAKRIVTLPAPAAASGAAFSFDLTYEFIIENIGHLPLTNISLKDNFETQFGNAFVGVVSLPAIEPIMTTAVAFGGANSDYEGNTTEEELLDQTAVLQPGEKLVVRTVVEVAPNRTGAILTPSGELANSAEAFGTAIGVMVNDMSDTGTDASDDMAPTGTNSGTFGDTGGTDDPTLFERQISPEICDNMLDDDGDGMVDCDDLDDCGFANPITLSGNCTDGFSINSPLSDWTYEWYSDGNLIAGETADNYKPSTTISSTIFTVKVINSAGCFLSSSPISCCLVPELILGGE